MFTQRHHYCKELLLQEVQKDPVTRFTPGANRKVGAGT